MFWGHLRLTPAALQDYQIVVMDESSVEALLNDPIVVSLDHFEIEKIDSCTLLVNVNYNMSHLFIVCRR